MAAAAATPQQKGPSTEQQLAELREIKKHFESLATTPRGNGITPGGMFAGNSGAVGGWNTGATNQWPEERLKRLQPYDMSAVDMLSRTSRKSAGRVSGIGPYLCKMAGMAAQSVAHQGTLSILANNYDAGAKWEGPSYTGENFCKQFGVAPVSSNGSYVTKSWDGREVRKAALAEGSGQTGGYTVPPQFMNELLTIAAEDGFIEPRAKVVPMNTRTVQWPMLDITTAQSSGTSPYFGGILAQWQPEAASISETEPAFRQSEWTAWDLVLYTVSSNQLLADNGIGLDALLTQLFGQAITWYKEFAYLQGKGAGSTMPLGILNAPATIAQNRKQSSHFMLQDAAAMLSHLQIRSWDDACWIMHQSVVPELIQMVDYAASGAGSTVGGQSAGGHFSWASPYGASDKGAMAMKLPNAFLNGLPLFFTEKLPQLGTKGDVMLVDWSRYVIGMRLDFQIDVSPHFLFRNNQLAWRVIARVDGKPWLNAAITDQAGFSISPFVVCN